MHTPSGWAAGIGHARDQRRGHRDVGHPRQSHRPTGRAAAGGQYRDRVLPYASLLMCEHCALKEQLLAVQAQGFRAFKIGWGPFGRTNSAMDESIVRSAREVVSPNSLLMVDAGASDAFWAQDYKCAV